MIDRERFVRVDPWWGKEYVKLTLMNYKSIPIFHKLLQINGEYEYTFLNVREKYSSIESENSLKIRTLDKEFVEKATQNTSENSLRYYKRFKHQDYVQECFTFIDDNSEHGFEKHTFADGFKKWTWVKTKDNIVIQEHFPHIKIEFYTLELEIEESKSSEESKYSKEIIVSSYYKYNKKVDIIIGEFTKHKEEKETRNKFTKISVTKKPGYEKTKNKKVFKRITSIKKVIKKGSQKIKNKLILSSIDSSILEEEYEENDNERVGFKMYKIESLNNKNLEINWKIIENRLSAIIKITGAKGEIYEKKIIKEGINFTEIEDFCINSKRWGNIKDYSSTSSISMNWTSNVPNIYNSYIQKYRTLESLSSSARPNKDLYKYVNLTKYEADFIFNIIEAIDEYNINVFSPLTQSIFFENNVESSDFFNKLHSNFIRHKELNEKFISSNSLDSDLIDPSLALEQLYRKELMSSFIIESLLYRKKRCYVENFKISDYLILQPYVFKLLYYLSVRSTIVSLQENREHREFIIVTKKKLVESQNFSMICTICNTHCHNECKAVAGETDLGVKSIKECRQFVLNQNKCAYCLSSCHYKYHAVMKIEIKTYEKKILNSDFNNFNSPEQFVEAILNEIKDSEHLTQFMLKVSHFILFTRNKLLKLQEPQLSFLLKDFKSMKKLLKLIIKLL